MVELDLPKAFDSEGESNKFLARMKSRASKNFRWTRSDSLQKAMYLAFWCHIFGQDDEALEVCKFLSAFQFAGNHDPWTWVQGALALYARLLRQRNSNKDEEIAAHCIQRIRNAGFIERRLSGTFVNDYMFQIETAVKEKDKTGERDWRLLLAKELCTIIEMGGSDSLPTQEAEQMYQKNMTRLRELVG